MQFEFLFLGKTKESYLAAGINDFAERISRYAGLQIRVLKDCQWRKGDSPAKSMEREAAILQDAISRQTMLVALDRQGRQLASEELAEQISRWEMNGHSHVTFVIGGALGLAPAILDRAHAVISLSRMTFTHEMTRFILLEQFYRALTINAGEKYHK